MNPDILAVILHGIDLLRVFNPPELGQLISAGSIQTFEPDTNVIIEGELSSGMYVILEGTVWLYRTNKLTSKLHEVLRLNSGSYFGEMSLLDDQPREVTARAITYCDLFYLSREGLKTVLEKSPETQLRFYQHCVTTLSSKLRSLDENLIASQYQLWRSAFRKDGRSL